MPKQQHVERVVHTRIPKGLLSQLSSFVSHSSPNLWGEHQPKHFTEQTLYVTLYKDLRGYGYHRLAGKISKWYRVATNTLRHNIKEIRKCLRLWGRRRVDESSLDDIFRDSTVLPEKKNLLHINLLID